MTKRFSVLALFLLFGISVDAQQNTGFINPNDISITWELLENNYQGKRQMVAALEIKNNSKKQSLPASGWELYFNHTKAVATILSGNVNGEFINGDFDKIWPNENFKELKPGQAVKINYIGKIAPKKINDAPSSFYFVWNGKTYPVKNYTISPMVNSGINSLSTQELYERYKTEEMPFDEIKGVFPTPVKVAVQSGELLLTPNFTIVAADVFSNEAQLLSADFEKIFGKKAVVQKAGDAQNAVVFKQVQGLGAEAYQLAVNPKGITIEASHPAGAFYAIKSLVNLFPAAVWQGKSKPFAIKSQLIKDEPRFAYRGFMLDVARNFQPKQEVKKIIDLMAAYKLNTLHFHLNDDEGWRLEIPSLPELTEVGSKRGHTFTNANLMPSYGSGPETTNPFGTGHYTKADFIEILKYATQRHIKVIPEIETPGHARAAIKSMLYRYEKYMAKGDKQAAEAYLLTEIGDQSKYTSVQGFNDNVINAALPSTYKFLTTVIDDIMNMYAVANAPLATIHMGGDEVPDGVWTKSKAVKKMIDAGTIKDINGLWYYFFDKVSQIFKQRNLYISGWEEIAMRTTLLDGKKVHIPNPEFLNDNFRPYVWNAVWGRGNEDLAYKMANAGYKVVLASASNFYFDLAYTPDLDEPGLYWAGYVDTDKPFYFNPYDYYKIVKEDVNGKPFNRKNLTGLTRLTDYGKTNIVGLQCLLWAERINGPGQWEYMLLPKLLGFAERAWGKSPDWAEEKDEAKSEVQYAKAWSKFANTLGKKELPLLDNYLGGVNYRIPPVGAMVKEGKVFANTQFPGLQIRYTTDGTEPTLKSKLYENPIPVQKGIKFKAFNTKGRGSKATSL